MTKYRTLSTIAACIALAATLTAQQPAPAFDGGRHLSNALVIHGLADSQIYPLHTRVNYTTVIMLPQGEKILDFLCGDKADWVLEGDENLAYIRPATPEAKTNINLVTSMGHIYTFDLAEVSNLPDVPTDQKVIVRPIAGPDVSSNVVGPATSGPRFVSATEYNTLRQELQLTEHQAQKQVEADRQHLAESMHFDYAFKSKSPFHVLAIYDDGKFTYIKVDPRYGEKPALYEMRDGKPDLENYEYSNGIYTVTHLVEQGYLKIGKKTLDFKRVQH